jgi:Flp pilus assembly protein TadG
MLSLLDDDDYDDDDNSNNNNSCNAVFLRDMVYLRNISVDTLHKGDTDDDNDYNDNNNNNNNNMVLTVAAPTSVEVQCSTGLN